MIQTILLLNTNDQKNIILPCNKLIYSVQLLEEIWIQTSCDMNGEVGWYECTCGKKHQFFLF
jgi:hypothetical protein